MNDLGQIYNTNKPTYELALNSLIDELKGFFEREHQTVDVQQVYGRVKELQSIEEKIKSHELKTINDLDDIVATSVICHTRSDTDRAIQVLGEYLPKKFKSLKSDPKRTQDGYSGHHFNFVMEQSGQGVKAEIQVKTVLQNSWSIQSHKYLYKTTKEGDADILARTVAGIFENCENLWELVKKTKSTDLPTTQLEELSKEIKSRLQSQLPQDEKEFSGLLVEKIISLIKPYSDADQVELIDILEGELNTVKKTWANLYKNPASILDAEHALEEMEKAVKGITLIGLYAIKYKKIDLLNKVLAGFSQISNLASRQDGLIVLLSVPGASLHNSFYYFGILALKLENYEAVKTIIDFKIELERNGRSGYQYIWSTGSIMAPELIPGANLTFDRLKNYFTNDDRRVLTVLSMETERFIELICQFNMLFCIKAQQIEESGSENFVWAYPNFGRFYSHRVTPLVRRILHNPAFARFPELIFGEKADEFNQKTDLRISRIAKQSLGSGFFWQSITRWFID
jgi:ppGpp synthetase/RelA/SpoT-type nucleotidyltranferase